MLHSSRPGLPHPFSQLCTRVEARADPAAAYLNIGFSPFETKIFSFWPTTDAPHDRQIPVFLLSLLEDTSDETLAESLQWEQGGLDTSTDPHTMPRKQLSERLERAH